MNFQTNPQGDIDKVVMSLDEAEALFTLKPEALKPELLKQLAGTYATPTDTTFQVALKEENALYLVFPGQAPIKLIHYKGLKFRLKEFSDSVYEFVIENGEVKALNLRRPGGEVIFTRK